MDFALLTFRLDDLDALIDFNDASSYLISYMYGSLNNADWEKKNPS